jgi:hypothetical protein
MGLVSAPQLRDNVLGKKFKMREFPEKIGLTDGQVAG